MIGVLDLAADVAKEFGIHKTEAKSLVAYVFKAVSEYAAKGEDVSVRGFGVFKPRPISARKGRNLKTGAVIDVPPSMRLRFTVGKELKEAVKSIKVDEWKKKNEAPKKKK